MTDLIARLESADSHVQLATKVFRDCGFTLAAMQFKRPQDQGQPLWLTTPPKTV